MDSRSLPKPNHAGHKKFVVGFAYSTYCLVFCKSLKIRPFKMFDCANLFNNCVYVHFDRIHSKFILSGHCFCVFSSQLVVFLSCSKNVLIGRFYYLAFESIF